MYEFKPKIANTERLGKLSPEEPLASQCLACLKLCCSQAGLEQEVEYGAVDSSPQLRLLFCSLSPSCRCSSWWVFVCLFVRTSGRGRSTLASFRSYTQERKIYQLELEDRAWSSQIKTQAAETVSPPHLELSTSPSYVLPPKCFTVPSNTTSWGQPSKIGEVCFANIPQQLLNPITSLLRQQNTPKF